MPARDILIIVPLFNEEGSLERLKEEMDIFMSACEHNISVLFVDDGSVDRSPEIIRDICSKDSRYAYITLDRNMGLSAALKAGIDNADSKWVAYIDSDLQTSP